MKVSIIIAILNSHKVAVRQLRHFKKMGLPDSVEIIFVDDGSNPPLSYENCGLNNFKILYTNDKRPWTQGLARNMGAKEAKGEHLFFTDIDHIITKEAINDVLNFDGDKMNFYRYFGILDRMGDVIKDRESMIKFGLAPQFARGRKISEDGSILAGVHLNTYAVRKTIFERIGGYEPRFCQSMFHMGAKGWSEESRFNSMYKRLSRSGQVKDEIMAGSKVYHYPVSKFRTDRDNNPFGLFHKLSLEPVPQPMKS